MMKNYSFEIAKNQYFTTKNNSAEYIKSRKIIGFVTVVLSLFVFDGAFGQIAQRGTSTSDNNNGGSLIITKPTGVVSGDIMFANIATRGSNTLSDPTSSGWTLIDGRVLNAGNRWGALLYKIAGAAEPANYTFTLDADADGNVGTIVAFSGVDNTTPFDVATGTINTANSATVTANSITTTTANAAVIMFAMEVSNDRSHTGWTTTSPGVLTELYDDARTNRARVAAAWSIKATAGATGNGTATLSGAERNGGILIALRRSIPTITSLSATSGCPFSTFTINGTNLLSPTAVTIGGTAATINSSTATTINVTAGSGTTGTVTVTTAGGSATSASTYTISAIPVITTQPVATSVCTTGTTTFSVVATGATTYQWRRNLVVLTNVAPYSNVTTATLTITNPATTDAGNFDVIVGNAVPCEVTSNAVALTVNTVPTASITPNPATAATGVCYAGTGAVTSVSWAATAGATSYDVYFGAGSLPGTVTSNVATNSYPTGTLLASTTYFWQVVAKNACGDAVGSSTWTFTTGSTPCYCASSGGTIADGVTGVVFNTISNTGTAVNVAYTDYTSLSTTVVKGFPYNLNVFINTGGNYVNHQTAWIDWNGDGDFVDAGESFPLGTATNVTNGLSSLCPLSITIPAGAITGNVRMRIQSKYNSVTGSSCATGFDGEVEDYTLSIAVPTACVTPTAQPTALVLTPAATSISGSFTAASPAPNNYLVVYNTTGVTPTPADGTTYPVGGVITGGTVGDIDNNTTFNITGLTLGVTYYVYVFSYNSYCTGGPLYFTTGPLNGSTTTTYCTPSSTTSVVYISGITSVGTLVDVSNSPTTYSAGGYGNFTATTIATQIPGGGINIDIALAGNNVQFIRAYVDWNNNGLFTDAGELVYTSGTTATGNTSFGFVVPVAQAIGNCRMRLRTRSFSDSSTIDPCTTGYATGEAEDYTISVVSDCPAKISSVTNGFSCGVNTAVTLTAVGTAGTTEYRWYTSEVAVVPTATTATGTWTTGLLPATTTYYVTAYNGSCESLTRTEIKATIRAIANVSFSPAAPVVCGEDTVISITATGDFTEEDLFAENFELGLGGFSVVTTTNSTGQINAPWSVKTSTYTPTDTSVWRPAINSGTIGDKFAFTTSDYSSQTLDTQLVTTTSINSATFINLTLTFKHYYSDYGSSDTGTVDVSTNGGTSWTSTAITYNADAGSASKFVNASVDLTAFAGQTNLKFRFRYNSGWSDGWAIDDVRLYGTKPLTSTTFSWTGGAVAYIDAATMIPYVAQNVSTIYIKPTPAQLSTASWTFTATATLANGCPAGQNITVTNLSKVWQGITSDWSTANNWLPLGVPTAANCVIIPDVSVISGSGTNAYAKTLRVKSTGDLEIQSNNNLIVTDEVTVETDGVLTVRNNASLVQINNVTNSGSIRMERTASMRRTDYVYWSSPVAGFASSAISPTTATNYIYKWIPTIGTNTNGWGNWTSGSETMTVGKGYIVRGPSAFTTTLQNFTASFIGVPNNGTISMGVQRGTYDGADYNTGVSSTLATNNDDNWNLLGNPYPSAINPTSFLAANTNLAGFVKVWSHGTAPSTATANPFYNTYTYNYSLSDYVTYNGSGSTAGPGVNNIAAGQGFFTLMNHTSAGTSETVTFNNAMRRDGSGNVYSNNQFYRNAQSGPADASRIWIDLITPNNASSRALVGYVDGATNENDRIYDAFSDPKYIASFYSLLNNVPMEIQGKALPFDPTDVIPMGFKTITNGSHTIAIATADGLFTGDQTNIYLEDSYLNVVHNLKLAPYTFTTNTGTFNNRFVLRYAQNTLGNNNYDYNNDVNIFANDNINITSSSLAIKNVVVYDVLGKVILDRKNISKNEITLTDLKPTSTVLIVKVTLDTDVVVTKKIIY